MRAKEEGYSYNDLEAILNSNEFVSIEQLPTVLEEKITPMELTQYRNSSTEKRKTREKEKRVYNALKD